MVYKIYIGKDTWFHDKNREGLELLIQNGFFEKTSNIDESNIIFYISPSPMYSSSINEIDIYDIKYKDKIIIIGPHFTVYPSSYTRSLNNNINNNLLYNLLSKWVCDFWKLHLGDNFPLPLVQLPYPVNTELFKPDTNVKKDVVVIYIKNRSQNDYQYIIDYMRNNNYNIKIFNYKNKYNQEDYINTLNKAIFCIWIGCHESQGFALQEALSLNIPLLVYNVIHMGQEEGQENDYNYCNTLTTSASYWDNKCGELFYKKEDFVNTLNKLIINIELNNYNPREFIMENLSPIGVYNKYWKPVIENKFALILKNI